MRNELKITEPFNSNIILLLPQSKRDLATEKTIVQGLTEYFKKQYIFHKNICRNKLNKGIVLFIVGFIIMLLNSWFSFRYEESFVIIFQRILLEPAGWFLLWAAFEFIFYDFAKLKTVCNFYQQLSASHIKFINTE